MTFNPPESLRHPRRSSCRAPLLAVLIATLAVLCALPSPARAQLVEFTFNPPDGLKFTQNMKMTQTKDLGPKGVTTDFTESKTEFTVTKTPTGYSVTAVPLGSYTMRNGERYKNTIMELIRGLPLVYETDPNGLLLNVRGFEGIGQKLQDMLPPATAQAALGLFNEETLVRKEKSEWHSRYGKYSGAKGKVGEGWEATEDFTLPTGGAIKFYSAAKVQERMQCGQRICIRMLFDFSTDPDAVRDFLGKAVGGVVDAAGAVGRTPPTFSDVTLKGGGERTLEPSTMLIRSEKIRKTVTMKMRLQDQAGETEATILEEKEYTYDYPRTP